MNYFRRVTGNSNTYGQDNLKNEKFGGIKWKNITVQEMLHFYALMLKISIDPRHHGGYNSYFESISINHCSQGYTVSLEAYGGRDSKITSFSHFRQIRSTYHPEFGEYAVGDKFHQLIFLIRCINRSATRNFDFGSKCRF